MPISIAVVQFQITHLDLAKNISRIESFVRRASRKGVRVVVFPEDCMTGSIFGDLSRLDTTHMIRNTFQKLAKQYAIDIVTGSCMEGTPEGNFNTSYYIDARGEVLGEYRKNHLYPSEYRFLKPGTEAPVFDTSYGKVGIVICWDMLFPEIFARMKAQGVQVIFCPSYWYREIAASVAELNPHSEEQQMDALCVVRALETNIVLVYCNAAGEQTYKDRSRDTLIGHSQITLPVVGAIKRMNHHREGVFVAEVDLKVLEKTRRVYCS